MAILEFVHGPQAGRRLYLSDEVFLGRSTQEFTNLDYICVPDAEVSRWHARLQRVGEHYQIEDLDSTNGTLLRGAALPAHVATQLADGDEIRLGGTRLRFHGTVESSRGEAPPRPQPVGYSRPDAPALRLSQDTGGARSVSVMLSAPGFLSDGPPGIPGAAAAALDRLQAVTRISVALGTVREPLAVAERVLDQIFAVFPGAHRACMVTGNEVTEAALRPLAWRERDATKPPSEFRLSRSIARLVLHDRHSILSEDVQTDSRFDGAASLAWLPSSQLMCAPLLVGDEVLGLIQVDAPSATSRFAEADLHVLTGLCAQAAIALKNAQLYTDIEHLLDGFIRASVQAIEARDPSTAGHSFRVAEYSRRLGLAVNRSKGASYRAVSFSDDQIRELHYAALLHDFGKVGVREHVLRKAKKLYPDQMELLRARFRYAAASSERNAFAQLLDEAERHSWDSKELGRRRRTLERHMAQERDRLRGYLEIVLRANEPTESPENLLPQLEELLAHAFVDGDEESPLLLDAEFASLTLARGSLGPNERREIESHVSHTYAFLKLIPWTPTLAQLPEIAYGHHEKLDGTGYPRGIGAADLPLQTRILTIADIYDALTSGDRPYRAGIPEDLALAEMEALARAGEVDDHLLGLFVEAKCWQLPEKTRD